MAQVDGGPTEASVLDLRAVAELAEELLDDARPEAQAIGQHLTDTLVHCRALRAALEPFADSYRATQDGRMPSVELGPAFERAAAVLGQAEDGGGAPGMAREEACDRCDGVGWYEGGPTLKTTCERCGGTGVRRP